MLGCAACVVAFTMVCDSRRRMLAGGCESWQDCCLMFGMPVGAAAAAVGRVMPMSGSEAQPVAASGLNDHLHCKSRESRE